MTMLDRRQCQELLADVEGLILYHAVCRGPVGEAATNLLYALAMERNAAVPYVRLVRELWSVDVAPLTGDRWQDWLLDRVLADENTYVAALARGDQPSPSLLAAAQSDLARLQGLLTLDGPALAAAALRTAGPEWRGNLPPWPAPVALPASDDPAVAARRSVAQALAALTDWPLDAPACLADFHQASGSGRFARYFAFQWSGQLEPVVRPDLPRLTDLVGLQSTVEAVTQNTEALLRGLPANHVLLYGDRGTGKSTLVRSLLTTYGAQGLRLVQLPREYLADTSRCVQALGETSLPTVLFVDDLSFEETEAGYKSFKAALEGALGGFPANVRVYATSNRRQLVRQRASERPGADGDELHPGDTLQEKLSLVDRFGLALPFMAPDQDEFLTIIRHLAPLYGIRLDEPLLRQRALLWVQQRHGRNGRSARQFLSSLAGELGLES